MISCTGFEVSGNVTILRFVAPWSTLSAVRPSPRARTAFLLLYGALLAWQVDRWCFTRHGVVSTWAARHDGREVSAGSPRGVLQTFVMGADGLDGVWLRPLVTGGAPRGELLVDLLQWQGDSPQRLMRVAVPAAEAVRGDTLHVPFRPMRASRGVTYQLHVRHVHAGNGPPIRLATSRADAVRGASLFADGVEQWGDLVLETSSRRATLPYWLHEVLRPWPGWVRSVPAVIATLAIFNLVLGWACARAAGLVGDEADVPVASGALAPPPGGPAMPLATGAVLIVVCAGAALAARPTGRFQSLDLIAALPDARHQTTWPSVHAGIAEQAVLIDGHILRAIVALPTSTIRWTVQVPRDAVLRFGAAMRPDMWERRSDGIEMRVRVEHAAGATTVTDYTLVPMQVPAHKRLFATEVPLQPWTGQQVTIVFETTPERWGNAVNDVPVWTEPRIEWSRSPSAGRARVVR